MLSFSSAPVERGLDTMVLVYSLLQGHPATVACEQMLRTYSGWFTSPAVFFEAKSVLTKVYGEDPRAVTNKLVQFAGGPITLLETEPADMATIMALADNHSLDFVDALLLHLARKNAAAYLVTDDGHLANVCSSFNITAQSPLDTMLRQAIAAWEMSHIPPKGLLRVLRRIHQWLNQSYPQAAQDFWSKTGSTSHLP